MNLVLLMKPEKQTFLLIVIMLAGGSVVSAQNIQTASIEWTCNSTFDATNGVATDEVTKVTTSPEHVVWYNKDGEAQKTFSVSGLAGSWTNVSSNGSVVINMTYGDNSAIAHFSRSTDAIRIRIHLISEPGSPIYELTVNSLTVN